MECVLGIDVGGTSIKAGLFSVAGDLLGTEQVPTGRLDNQAAFDEVTAGLLRLVTSAGATAGDVHAVGLDVPGPVDDQGRIGLLPNITLDADALKAAIRQAFPAAALAFVNDANAAALGELWQGSAKDVDSFVMVTLGTGVGGGVVCGGRLVSGAFGAGGEIGHITVNEGEERVCGCGRRGCLEQYASAKGIVYLYGRECERRGVEGVAVAHETDTLSVFEASRAGDEAATAAIGTMAERLGYALAQISCVVDPACYLIGGGVAGGFDLFGGRLGEAFRSHCLKPSAAAEIRACSLGNEAGMYGAAYSALQVAQDA
jgi:glucokinase